VLAWPIPRKKIVSVSSTEVQGRQVMFQIILLQPVAEDIAHINKALGHQVL
jgi:hypothetical protein